MISRDYTRVGLEWPGFAWPQSYNNNEAVDIIVMTGTTAGPKALERWPRPRYQSRLSPSKAPSRDVVVVVVIDKQFGSIGPVSQCRNVKRDKRVP